MRPPSEQSEPRPERVADFSRKHRTGLVTLVFTDLVESTTLMRELGDQAGTTVNQRRRQVVRQILAGYPEGEEIETAGDSFLLLFARPSAAVRFALQVQARLRELSEATGRPVEERIGVHLGEVLITEFETAHKPKDLYGIQVATCARVMSLAQGGQILLTRAVFDNARALLKGEGLPGLGPLTWVSHGAFLLKGLDEPVEVCEVGDRQLPPPTSSEKAQRYRPEGEEPVLGWRPALAQPVPNTPWILEEKLGEGGFGEVWKARHPRLKECRVFKFCFRADRARALRREVTLLNLVKDRIGEHPHIVRLHEVNFDEPPYFLEMDYVGGRDLRHWCGLQGGVEKVPFETRLEIVAQAAEALQAAHDAGVIHRDVKPGNILLAPSPSKPFGALAKLADFGIGRVVSGAILPGLTEPGFTQTMVGDMSASKSGTQLYMAPELLAGQMASTRSDIYSLGVVLYQLIAGDLTVPVTTDWADRVADPLLREDLQLCFAGDPQKRFAGAAQFAERLRQLPARRQARHREQAELAAREKAAYRRGIVRTAALALVALGVVAGLALFAWRKARLEARQRVLVEAQEWSLRQNLYASDTRLAQRAMAEEDFGVATALLDGQRPRAGQTDVRGWEWHYLRQACRGDMIATLPGVEFDFGLAFSPDRKFLVALHAPPAGGNVYEVDSGRAIHRFSNTNFLCSASFSPAGPWLALASPGHLEILHTNTWEPVAKWFSHPEQAAAAASQEPAWRDRIHVWPGVRNPVLFSPDGQTLVTDTADGLCLWDTATWRPALTLTNQHPVRAFELWGDTISFSADGERVAWACQEPDGAYLSVWRLADVRRMQPGRKPLLRQAFPVDRTLMGISLSPDARHVACGYFFGGLGLWEVATGRGSATLTNAAISVMALQFLADNQTLAFGSRDRNVHLARLEPGPLLRPLSRLWGHTNEIWSLTRSRDGTLLASGGKDGQIHLWKTAGISSAKPVRLTWSASFDGYHRIGSLFSADSAEVLAWRPDVGLGSYRLPAGTPTWNCNVAALPSPVESVGYAAEHRIVWHARQDGNLRGLDPQNGTEVVTLAGHPRVVNRICVARDGMTLVSGAVETFQADGSRVPSCPEIRVWELPGGKLKRTIVVGGLPQSLALSPDGFTLAVGLSAEIELWDLPSGRKTAHWEAHKIGIISLAFSEDGALLVSGGYDNLAKVWETVPRRLRHSLMGHSGGPVSACFSPDGRTVVTGGLDQTLRFWSVAVGRELLQIRTEGTPFQIGFSPDGRYFAVSEGGQPGRMLVYDAQPLQEQ